MAGPRRPRGAARLDESSELAAGGGPGRPPRARPTRAAAPPRDPRGKNPAFPRLDPGQIEQVGDHPAEPIGIVPDPGEIVRRLLGLRAGDAVEEIVHEAVVRLRAYPSGPRKT